MRKGCCYRSQHPLERSDFHNLNKLIHRFDTIDHALLHTPLILASDGGGESDLPACGPSASFTVHLVSSAVTPAGYVHKSRGDNVVHMWV